MEIRVQQPTRDDFEVTRLKDNSPVEVKKGISRRDALRLSLLGLAIASPVGKILLDASKKRAPSRPRFPEGPLPIEPDLAFDQEFASILQPGKEVPIIDAIVPIGSDVPRFKRIVRKEDLHDLNKCKADLLYIGKNEIHPLIEKVVKPMCFLGNGELWLLYQSEPFGRMVLVNAGDPTRYLNQMAFVTISSVEPHEGFHPSRGHNVIKAAVNFIPEQVMYSIPA